MFAEAGAYSFSDADDLIVRYARLFDLPTVQEESRGLASIFFIRGNRIKPKSGEITQYPGDLTAEERRIGLDPLWGQLVKSVFPEIRGAAASDWPPSSLKKYDQMTFAQFLRRQGFSPDAIAANIGAPSAAGLSVEKWKDMVHVQGGKRHSSKSVCTATP
jgi:hypothetical protein